MRRLRNLITALALSLAACGGGGPTLSIVPAPPSSPPAYSVLYSFNPSSATSADGNNPYAGLIQDSNGNLYGTTYIGGTSGFGTVFQLSPPSPPATHWTETVLYSFAGGSDGAYPRAGLILDSAGNLYGTTYAGGAHTLGTVFQLAPTSSTSNWTETLLHSFAGGSDGANPRAGLILDSAGNLYGTTYAGGTPNLGTVFRLSPPISPATNWTETVLHPFAGGSDGANPRAGLILDSAGNLYGTTSGGTNDLGTVFELAPPISPAANWTETLLHSFVGGTSDGAAPYAGLILDSAGNLYGTTYAGGTPNLGTVFRLSPPISPAAIWTETLLYSFLNTPDGASPYARLILDSAGNLYGTTSGGGGYGAGSVFQLSPPSSPALNWTETVRYSFARYSRRRHLPMPA